MFLLDTNVVSELRRPDRSNANVAAWARQDSTGLFYMSVITILELEHGTLLMERRDAAQGAALRTWLDREVVARYRDRILPLDLDVARRTARLHVPDRKPDRDCMIAATALAHDLIVVTRNVADFAPMGVRLLNPWLAA